MSKSNEVIYEFVEDMILDNRIEVRHVVNGEIDRNMDIIMSAWRVEDDKIVLWVQ